jgi:hypothetical protein
LNLLVIYYSGLDTGDTSELALPSPVDLVNEAEVVANIVVPARVEPVVDVPMDEDIDSFFDEVFVQYVDGRMVEVPVIDLT